MWKNRGSLTDLPFAWHHGWFLLDRHVLKKRKTPGRWDRGLNFTCEKGLSRLRHGDYSSSTWVHQELSNEH
jgi:hypothetical protein